jgi:hypothetical protein
MRMKKFWLVLGGLAALCAGQLSGAQEKVVVMVPAALDPNAPISDAARRECNVDTHVGTQVFQRVGEKYPGTEQVASADGLAPDKTFLKVTLMSVVGHGGGGWSGSKAISIRADVLRGTKVIATQRMNRQSGGGAFGGVMGTCAIFERIAGALGRDVAAWLPAALMMIKYDASAPEQKPAPEQKEEPKPQS